MKPPRSHSESDWAERLRLARTDAPPSVDLPSLLRAVRQAAPAKEPSDWTEEFTALFASRRVVFTCSAAACALALFTSWEAWEFWQAMPWAQLLAASTGGAS